MADGGAVPFNDDDRVDVLDRGEEGKRFRTNRNLTANSKVCSERDGEARHGGERRRDPTTTTR
jgi:hypothetical protein